MRSREQVEKDLRGFNSPPDEVLINETLLDIRDLLVKLKSKKGGKKNEN